MLMSTQVSRDLLLFRACSYAATSSTKLRKALILLGMPSCSDENVLCPEYDETHLSSQFRRERWLKGSEYVRLSVREWATRTNLKSGSPVRGAPGHRLTGAFLSSRRPHAIDHEVELDGASGAIQQAGNCSNKRLSSPNPVLFVP